LAGSGLLISPGEASAQPSANLNDNTLVSRAVGALTNAGILRGRDASSLIPQEYVTRAQLAVYLARVLGLKDSTAADFTDVIGPESYFGAVGAMYEAGLITGTSPTTFSPDELVSRQQAAVWVVNSIGFLVSKDEESTVPFRLSFLESAEAWLGAFQDRLLIDPGNARAVGNAYRLGIVDATADGWFYPKLPLSWGDMAVMLERAFVQPLSVRTAYPAALAAQSSYPILTFDSEGPLVWYIEYRLRSLMYRPGPIDGVYDKCTRDAVLAFQKVERIQRDGIAGGAFWERIFTAQTPVPKLSDVGTRIEIDLGRQVLFMITDNTVWKIVHIATGTPEHRTKTGHFKIQEKYKGWVVCNTVNGIMYYPSYVVSKTAIHGYKSVPMYPASHGCIRVPVWMAVELFYELPTGTPVDIYQRYSS
jgi:N-acetylmuramoyl-L-alanine amidase